MVAAFGLVMDNLCFTAVFHRPIVLTSEKNRCALIQNSYRPTNNLQHLFVRGSKTLQSLPVVRHDTNSGKFSITPKLRFSYQDMFLRILKKTSIDKHLNVFLHMMSRLTGIALSVLVVAAVASASTLVAVNILKSEETETFSAKVDFAEGNNHYTLIEVDEGDNDEEKQVTLLQFVFSVTGELDTVNWDFGDGNSGTGAIISHQYKNPETMW